MITESNYYELFIESVYQLAETIVIKSEQSANAINLDVKRLGFSVSESNKKTWKYYLNLSGEYHISDEPMYVRSLDNLEEILFNKENLAIHRATFRDYAYGSRHYKELVSNYPNQEMLILGILYPIDIDKAIEARDFSILGYPSHLVEFNEESLIDNIQYWLDAFKKRWYNIQYTCDDLYDICNLATMYQLLVPCIITLRLKACKTREAHSYHVKQYLASHGGLDKYIDQMTAKQALWVYRNILYIEHNSGQQDTFAWLIEHLLTERTIPIAEFTMRHDIENLNVPDPITGEVSLYPEPKFRRLGINPISSGDETDRISLETLLAKEDKLKKEQPGNPEYTDEKGPDIRWDFENSRSNVVLTKALESEMYDYSDSSPYSLEEVLVNHWFWLASNGLYTAYIGVDNPKTGERIVLRADEAAVFAFYAMWKATGQLSYVCVPPLVANRVQRIPTPTATDIRKVADYNYVSLDDAKFVLSKQPDIPELISTEAFYNKCVEIFDSMDLQRRYVAYQENQTKRGMMKGMVNQIYSDNICYVAEEGITYDEWFAQRNIKIEDFTDEELGLIYWKILREATGLDLTNTRSIRNLQDAMIRMLRQLSSYSIQVLKEINATSILMADWATIRLGDNWTTQRGQVPGAVIVDAGVQSTLAKVKMEIDFDVNIKPQKNLLFRPKSHLELEINVQARMDENHGFSYKEYLDVASVGVSFDITPYQNDVNIVPVPGVDLFLTLTEEQKNSLTDFTGNNCFYPRKEF